MDHTKNSVSMLRNVAAPPRAAETIERARALRAEHARAAAYQAYRDTTASTVTPLVQLRPASDDPTTGDAA
jgi:hypothetical protein